MKFALAVIALVSLGGGPMSMAAPAAATDWPEYLGGPERNHYSLLREIDAGNVGRLKRAWEYHTGDFGILEANPIVVDGILYGTTAANGVFALDAATGKERWRFYAPGGKLSRVVRGVTYWARGDDRRIFFTAGEWLWALDAVRGQPVASFGKNGKTSLKLGLGEQAGKKDVYSSTPGTLVGDILIMPTTVSEDADAALGSIQAFDARSGKLSWCFHTIPHPGETGYETWSKDSYKNINVGSANCWAGMAADIPRGILYVPTGSAAPDFWGGDRIGRNLFANCLVALEARTGKLLWYYQIVHHDLWDRDLPAPPNLLSLRRGGRTIDAVAQVTKHGLVFVFDRVTGEPLFPIKEVPVPNSELEGEKVWPTQPIPVLPKPFARQTMTEDDLSPYAANRDALLVEFRQAHKGLFPPLGKYDTLLFPGFAGGAEWGGAAVDANGVIYINASEQACIGRLKDAPKPEELARLGAGKRLFSIYCAECHGSDRAGNPLSGYPSLVDVANRRKRDEVTRLIATGAGRMPGFPMLGEADRQALANYLFGGEKAGAGAGQVAAGEMEAEQHTRYNLDGYQRFYDRDGYPANSPPWGTLTAIDLNTGEHLWRKILGEFKELTAKGIPPTGTENYGGPVVTASGLLFIAATMDNMIRAFDTKTGNLLWQSELPAGGNATPSTYEIAGRQYVVVACGGGRRLPGKEGDSYVAFALP